ncbi:MAG: hypothetical protein RLZZ292_4017 [Bacteroidota bacterium]
MNSFTEQDLLKWLEFAEQRESFQKLSKGETVKLQVNTHQIAKVNKETTDKTNFEQLSSNYQYAMAA